MKLEICHYDTCLPDYFGGHTTPHIQIPAYPMSFKELRESLSSELQQYVCGDLTELDSGLIDNEHELSEKGYAKIQAAINRIKPATKHTKKCFTDIELGDDMCELVYAYFLIMDSDDSRITRN